MTGWYMGDGMLYVYTPDYDFDTDFFNKANRYRMPGTTVNGSERVPKSYTGVWSIFNKYPTACGVSSGDFGLSMFELGYPEPDGDHNLFDTDITARKSNFFFDDEIVCVGTGIKDSSGLPVETVLDNRLVRDTDKLYINGNNVTPKTTGRIENLTPSKVYPTDTLAKAKDIYFDNMGGYLFEKEIDVRYRIYDNCKKYLEITLPHGENVSDGEYAYTLVPNVSREYFDAYKMAHPVSIECMSNTAHVVKKAAAGAIGYAFYEGGTACGITSSGIAAVMITAEDGELCINLSDPSHTQKNIRLSICLDTVKKLLGINEISAISYVSERTEATLENGVLTIEADVFEEASERHTVKLK
jgi:hyaluronate lyase